LRTTEGKRAFYRSEAHRIAVDAGNNCEPVCRPRYFAAGSSRILAPRYLAERLMFKRKSPDYDRTA